MPVSSVEKSTAEKIDQCLGDYVQTWPVSIEDVIEAEVATTLSREELPEIAAQMCNKKPPEFISSLLKSLEITAKFGGFEDMPKFNVDQARTLVKTAICKRLNSTKAASEEVALPSNGKKVQIVKTVKTGVLCTGNAWIPFGSFNKELKTGDEIVVVPAPDLQNKDKDRVLRDAYRQWQG